MVAKTAEVTTLPMTIVLSIFDTAAGQGIAIDYNSDNPYKVFNDDIFYSIFIVGQHVQNG